MRNLTLFLCILVFYECRKGDIGHSASCSYSEQPESVQHPKHQIFQDMLDTYVAQGLPGIALLVRDNNGAWAGSAGKADLSQEIDFLPCTVSKVASITKMFNGTLTHLLVEDGLLSLDDKVDQYLSDEILEKVSNCRGATVRQLMNHTTGIFDIITSTSFYLALLNNPDKHWSGEELIEFAYGKEPKFPLGSSCFYSNTNTLLLSLVLDKVIGRPHWEALREMVLNPLQMRDTYYYSHDKVPVITAQGYYDLYNNQSLTNVTNFNTGSGNGYGGFYSTVFDLQKFIEALVREKTILSESEMQQMTAFVEEIDPDDPNNDLYLGAGLMKRYFNQDQQSDRFGYGHTGRDLGYSANCFYFPNYDITCCFVVNYGTNAESELRNVFYSFQDELTNSLFE
ncbi:MAG: beta-lactamase family protein [Saprospiraceae bacterium]|nr:beta-lactamase family protein [Saprospiraceae bacterium]